MYFLINRWGWINDERMTVQCIMNVLFYITRANRKKCQHFFVKWILTVSLIFGEMMAGGTQMVGSWVILITHNGVSVAITSNNIPLCGEKGDVGDIPQYSRCSKLTILFNLHHRLPNLLFHVICGWNSGIKIIWVNWGLFTIAQFGSTGQSQGRCGSFGANPFVGCRTLAPPDISSP